MAYRLFSNILAYYLHIKIRKSVFVLILIILNLITLTSLTQNIPQDKKNYSLLWKIEGNQIKKPSYLFAF